MFDIFPRALASVASVLFPIFASYKALQSGDPAQLTPWLMYWVVLACIVLVESWTGWLLVWIPFFHYLRLFFLLYLVLPQTQGARILYQTQVHPWLQHHEARIDDFIATAHDHLRTEGLAYLRRAIAYVRDRLGLPAIAAEQAPPPPPTPAPAAAQSYTQALLSRFTLPNARWTGAGPAASPQGQSADFYHLVSSALGSSSVTNVAATRDRLRSLLSALDRAAAGETTSSDESGELRKSRSEVDFVRIDAESGEEDADAAGLHKRGTAGGSWMSWGWGGGPGEDTAGTSSAVEK